MNIVKSKIGYLVLICVIGAFGAAFGEVNPKITEQPSKVTIPGNSPVTDYYPDDDSPFVPVNDLAESYNGRIEYISSCLWSSFNDVSIKDSIMFCALAFGVIALDISEGPPFDTLSTLFIPGEAEQWTNLEVNGDYMYVARGDNGLFIVDISDVTNLSIVGFHPARDDIRRTTYSDGFLYMAEFRAGVTVLDVSDPAHPEQVSVVEDLGEVKHIAVGDSVALVSAMSVWHTLIISDPSNPVVAFSDSARLVWNSVIADTLAYVSNYENGGFDTLMIYNLKDPYSPELVGVFGQDYHEWVNSICLIDTVVFYNRDIINVADPAAPTLISTLRTYSGQVETVVSNDRAYVVRTRWINVYDVSDLENPVYDTTHGVHSSINGVVASDTLVFVTASFELLIVSVADIENPVLVGILPLNNVWHGRRPLNNGVLYIGERRIDVSNPTSPEDIGSFGSLDGALIDIQAVGDYAYLAVDLVGLKVFDISQSQDPVYLSTYEAPLVAPLWGSKQIISVQDTIVYLGTENGLHIINYADPTSPVNMASYGTNSYRTVDVDGDKACIAKYDLEFVDISDPTNPFELGVLDLNPNRLFYRIAYRDDYVYSTPVYWHFAVIDAADPGLPSIAETHLMPVDGPPEMFYSDSIIYVACYNGLMILNNGYYEDSGTVAVRLDIKPGSCPNPVNVNPHNGNNKAVLPAAILGTEDFDVSDVDPETILLNGIGPVRWNYEDVSTPVDKTDDDCTCSTDGPDGIEDLTLKFNRSEIVENLGDKQNGESAILTISGSLYDGSDFEGKDCVILVDSGRPITTSHINMEPVFLNNYPNPFNPSTVIELSLPAASDYALAVYNIAGQIVWETSGHHGPGTVSISINMEDQASGVYFYKVKVGDFTKTRKMILMK